MAKKSATYSNQPELLALGQAIRRLRKAASFSQEQLALQTGLDRSYMGGIERGEHNVATMNLCKIAVALSVTPSALLAAAGL